MVNRGSQLSGISGVCGDIMQFLDQHGLCFSKCLLRSCIHHVSDVETFLERLFAVPSLLKALILFRAGGMTTGPMFREAYQSMAEMSVSDSHCVQLAKKIGFEVYQTTKEYQISVQKDYWLSCIENRVYSCLHRLSDEELKRGQLEICAQYPGDSLKFPDIWNLIILSRCVRNV